ncbi:PQQ-dependent sugar dehydrogenase [Nocardioides sp. NPDC057577]|uniref:PQQ-dependent sugar dehydrogenase n=1 Tax=Nocardioides sp. NPDC057577 TaxID=3346171 RepID=UPI00366DB68A
METSRLWGRQARAGIAVGAMLAALLTPALSANAAIPGSEPVPDPIPEQPVRSSLGLVLQEVTQLPETEPYPAPTDQRLVRHNRINFIGEVPDGSGRMYVPDLNGPMYLLDRGQQHEYLDVKDHFPDFWSGAGLGSGAGFITFHPDFKRNGLFYTTHTERFGGFAKTPTFPSQTNPGSGRTVSVVTEWHATDPTADTFAGTSREVMRIDFAGQIHAIQQIDFNPTAERGDEDYGLLYIASGDGGNGVKSDDPQNLANPFGKILRIDPLARDGRNGAYGVPESNPFVDREGAIGEIWAYGMRDPHRFSWDVEKGTLLLGHIGQHAIEGVYDVRAGDNLGWSEIEGRLLYDNTDECALYTVPDDYDMSGYTLPVASFDHDPPANYSCTSDSGHAVSGGVVYRGKLDNLRGKYVFGDLVNGEVYWTDAKQMRRGSSREATLHEMQLFDTSGKRLSMQDFVDDPRVDLRFGTDSRRNLYLLAKANGKIWKVVNTVHKPWPSEVVPSLRENLVSYYDFEHPFAPGAREEDQGYSRTLLNQVNGGNAMQVGDSAYRTSNNALQTQQVNPEVNGNDDWKAGTWNQNGVASLAPFAGAEQITLAGWFKVDMDGPALNSLTADPADRFNAIGLSGVLSGNSDGHGVRALLELINVDGTLRLVALGRRLDEGASQTFAASADWQTLLPRGQWVHLAATFDYTTGKMALYRNGKAVDGFYTTAGDPWQVDGTGTSDTLPRGIKVGGSFPQDTVERNPCNCRMDSLMFLDRAITPDEARAQYQRFVNGR